MKCLLSIVICAAFSMPAMAQEVEAMKHGNAQAEAAAQARVDAMTRVPFKAAIQPEAQRSFSAQAAAVAESRKAQRLLSPRHPAQPQRALLDAQRL